MASKDSWGPQQMLAVLLVLTFLLAVMAHIKIFYIQQGSLSMFQVIGKRFRDLEEANIEVEATAPVVPDGPAAATATAAAVAPAVAPSVAAAKPALSTDTLVAFYGLSVQQRAELFKRLTASSAISGDAFQALWIACNDDDAKKRAYSFQQLQSSWPHADFWATAESTIKSLLVAARYTSGAATVAATAVATAVAPVAADPVAAAAPAEPAAEPAAEVEPVESTKKSKKSGRPKKTAVPAVGTDEATIAF